MTFSLRTSLSHGREAVLTDLGDAHRCWTRPPAMWDAVSARATIAPHLEV